jgi:hypothetical protein
MKTIKRILPVLFILLASFAARAYVLFDDASNYPYANGLIETQGQWYVYSPKTPHQDAFVTNNVLLLVGTNDDDVATPTNGWKNPTEFNFVSFRINVTYLPSADGSYICQLQSTNDSANVCHLFVDTLGTTVPGTYRLGIANFATEFTGYGALQPPINYPEDLATDVWYNVVMLYDTNQADLTFIGSTLWVNPSENDYSNVVNGDVPDPINDPGIGVNFVYGTDKVADTDTNQLDINISQVGFGPFAGDEGISNVIAGTTFDDVNSTNLPVFGIQPQPGTNYSGNFTTLYAVASGVDLTYQWYDSGGALSDGATYTGSTSDALTVTNLSVTDTYYCIVTDAYGDTAQSSNALETIITTPTPVFFPASVVAVSNSANLFTTASFTDTALGTGPISYQWYFAPTNLPIAYSPLQGQNSSTLSLDLLDLTYQGTYYVVASNSVDGGSLAFSPTNTLVELAPLNASILQLHNLMVSIQSQLAAGYKSTIYINKNNVTVSGYVTTYGGFGPSGSYSEFNIQDASGYGIEVYYSGFGNTNTPPVGTYVTVTGPVEVYRTQLEIAPASPGAIVTNLAPVIPLTPVLANSIYNQLVTNGLGTNAILLGDSLLTFTNCYLYGGPNGQAFGGDGSHSGNGGIFASNSYNYLYFTIGKYGVPASNTNAMEIYQYSEDYGQFGANYAINPFDDVTIPTNCFQLTGAYSTYEAEAQFEPSRVADYLVTAPAPFTLGISATNKAVSITWSNQWGSTYSVSSSTNIQGPWTQQAYGLTYYPSNGAFTDTNTTQAKFYYITSP